MRFVQERMWNGVVEFFGAVFGIQASENARIVTITSVSRPSMTLAPVIEFDLRLQ